ncbi:hypothetical protein [Morganella morganii]|uniref:hypothetical protein n=1 Tax=Morganella morganii TaxID=582 RepID=UPI000D973EA5|nr:hypothetical protein [Morganella morganii]SPX74394.1 Uncharacterised protein [Morganella morganii]
MEIKTYFVAFIDILGFKNIVEKERLSGYEGEQLNKLFDCHVECEKIFKEHGLDIVQFSDSIVISKAYDKESFHEFVFSVSEYQKLLLRKGFLCRGGIAVNKHYSLSSFLFSPALIDAYKVESEKAIYPRVVVSEDVINLVFPEKEYPKNLCKEYDGLFFINFLYKENISSIGDVVSNVVANCLGSKNHSIMQKGIWLANYSDYILKTDLSPQRFC